VAIDPLTGLLNRFGFQRRLEALVGGERGEARPFAVIILDIDLFKQINDRYGHLVGDHVLQKVAAALVTEVPSGGIVTRHGGEEFIVLLPDAARPEALAVAQRIRGHVEGLRLKRRDTGELLSPVTISAGVAVRGGGEPFEEVLGRADMALYLSKERGRNRVTGEEELEGG
jgi:diguanylate cyclase